MQVLLVSWVGMRMGVRIRVGGCWRRRKCHTRSEWEKRHKCVWPISSRFGIF